MSMQWKCHYEVKSLRGSAQTTGPDVLQRAIARQEIPWRKHLLIAKKNELWSVSERQQAKLENMLQKPVETTAEKACQHETQKL